MKKLCISLSIVVLFIGACATHTHTIGDGPQTGITETLQGNITFYLVLYRLIKLILMQ